MSIFGPLLPGKKNKFTYRLAHNTSQPLLLPKKPTFFERLMGKKEPGVGRAPGRRNLNGISRNRRNLNGISRNRRNLNGVSRNNINLNNINSGNNNTYPHNNIYNIKKGDPCESQKLTLKDRKYNMEYIERQREQTEAQRDEEINIITTKYTEILNNIDNQYKEANREYIQKETLVNDCEKENDKQKSLLNRQKEFSLIPAPLNLSVRKNNPISMNTLMQYRNPLAIPHRNNNRSGSLYRTNGGTMRLRKKSRSNRRSSKKRRSNNKNR